MCVAVCDSELIDKKFEEGDRQLDLTGTFFKGEEKSTEEARKILVHARAEDATFNFVGEKSVDIAKELSIAKDSGIIKIQDVPVALVLL